MKLDKLLKDATGRGDGNSARSMYHDLHAMLEADGHDGITVKGVEKWFVRGSLPSRWVGRIIQSANRRGRELDLMEYL